MQLPGDRADQLAEAALHGGMNVLVRIGELEASLLGLSENHAEAIDETRSLSAIEQLDLAEHRDVRKRTRDVVRQEPASPSAQPVATYDFPAASQRAHHAG